MDKNRWTQIAQIVDDLLKIEERSIQQSILEERCGDDVRLQQQVLELLKSIEESSDYWDSLFESNRLFIGNLTQHYNSSNQEASDFNFLNGPDVKEEVPYQIGLYDVKKRIGIGGMGEVFLASRVDEKFNQNVALKLIRHGITSTEQAKRFEQERIILSSLNHPNIARLLDGGISEDGRSYYVMEYVDGIPITEYCKKNECSLNQCLNLFKQVCKAVQYAHSNFIVHRDLKPENLLVNKEGVVKILDFGIAKMIDDNLDESDLLQTSAGLKMLSLKYAAPEQITLEPITTATDVYALGVLLFELLTNSHPLSLHEKTLKEAEYHIRNQQPQRPSSLNSRWKDKLKGDLDAIILKALRKESAERYESAQKMLDDIERYENSLPVSARHDSIPYLTKKFVKRHTIPLFFSSLILALIISFAIFYTHRIAQEKRIAELQAQKAEQVTLFLMDMFEANNPEETGGEELSVRDMLIRGETEAEKLQGYPELKAQMYEVIGEIYRRLGRYDKSESLFRQSLSIRQSIYGDYHSATVGTLDKLGLLLTNKADYSAADSILTLALHIRENYLNPGEVDLAQTLSNLAFATRRKGDNNLAEQFYRRSLELRKKHLGNNHPLTLENMNSLGVILHNTGNYEETEALFREVLLRRERQLSAIHPDVAISQNSLGALLMNTGHYSEADSLLKKALIVRKKLYGNEHPSVALTLNNLGLSHVEQNRLEEASEYLAEAYYIREAQLGVTHTNTAVSKFTLAKLMLKTNRPDSALHLYQDAYQIFYDNLAKDHSFTVRSLMGIGTSYLAKGNLKQAEKYLEDGYEKVKKIHPPTSLEYALASIDYSSYLIELGAKSRARNLLQGALETLKLIENQNSSKRQEQILALIDQTEPQDTL